MFKRAMGLTVAMLGVALTAPAVAQSAAVCRAHGQAALEAWTLLATTVSKRQLAGPICDRRVSDVRTGGRSHGREESQAQ